MLLLGSKLHLRHWSSQTLKHVVRLYQHDCDLCSYAWVVLITGHLAKGVAVALLSKSRWGTTSADGNGLGDRGGRVRGRRSSSTQLADAQIGSVLMCQRRRRAHSRRTSWICDSVRAEYNIARLVLRAAWSSAIGCKTCGASGCDCH